MDRPYYVNCKKCGIQQNRSSTRSFVCNDCSKKSIYPRVFYKNRLIVLHRDAHTCQCCGDKKSKLIIHHIDCDKYNNSPSNLITLCDQCHMGLHGRYTNKVLRKSNIYKLFPKEFRFGVFGKRFDELIIKENKPKKEVRRFFTSKSQTT